MDSQPRILSVDVDRSQQTALAAAFSAAGFVFRYVVDPRRTAAGVRQLQPRLVLVRSEVNGPVLADTLESMASDPAHANVPLVVLCENTADSPFVNGLRTGVVLLLGLPFHPSSHPARVRALLEELPRRSGFCSGPADPRTLAQLVSHLACTRRTGQLVLNQGAPDEGRAIFAGGRIESATYGTLSSAAAVQAMTASARGTWNFGEVGGDGIGVLLELGEHEAIEVAEPSDQAEVVSITVEKADLALPGPDTRLLFVDDDEDLCRMFSRLFTARGFQVQTAQDGIDGYQAAQARPFDIVVADLNMPRLDGWGMLRLLREDFRTRELPVAFLSCHDDYREALKAMDAGAQAYFSKGTRLESLVERVRQVLAPRRQARELLRSGQPSALLSATQLGPQWILREVGALGTHARLEANDGWASYELSFDAGELVHAKVQAGRHLAQGERALNAFVASRGAQAKLTRGRFPCPKSLRLPLEKLLEASCLTLNENERHLRQCLMEGAAKVSVNDALYAVYVQVGPRDSMQTARMVCEERLLPRDVLLRAQTSPIEVEETMRDLLRRGVISLSA